MLVYSCQHFVLDNTIEISVLVRSRRIGWEDLSPVHPMTIGICMTLKEYRMVFCAGLRDPCTRDVVRLSESVKILEPQANRAEV